MDANCNEFTLTVTASAAGNQRLFYEIKVEVLELGAPMIFTGDVDLEFDVAPPSDQAVEPVQWPVPGGLAGLTLQTLSGKFDLQNDAGDSPDAKGSFDFDPDLKCPAGEALFIVIDEGSIDNGKPYKYRKNGLPRKFFSGPGVNEHRAEIGLRAPLPAFSGKKVGKTYELLTGEIEDEAFFAVPTILPTWDDDAPEGFPTGDGLRNFVGDLSPFPHKVGPGLGTPDDDGDREALLDKIPDVTPLRFTDDPTVVLSLDFLIGKRVCGLVFDSDISINYGPLNGSLKGSNLGLVAFQVLGFGFPNTPKSDKSLPNLIVKVLEVESTCGNFGPDAGDGLPRIVTFGTLGQEPPPTTQTDLPIVGITKLCQNIGPAIDNLCFVRTDPPGIGVMWRVSAKDPSQYVAPGDGGSNLPLDELGIPRLPEAGESQTLCIGPVPAFGDFVVDFTVLFTGNGQFNVEAVNGP